jgi:Fe-S cluster assembly iron-binding protein IscA
LALDEPKESEAVEQVDGLDFIIEAQARPHISGQVIDYVRSWRGEGFAVRPAAGSCC